MLTTLYTILFTLVFTIGAVIGSFLNVLVYRIPRKINFVKGFSFCPSCQHRLYPKDLFPIFSYLFLKGKCRYCGSTISPRYMIVEMISGAIALLCYAYFSLPMAVLGFALGSILITITLIDADTMEIPDSLNIAIAVLAAASVWIWPDVGIVTRIIGFFAISIPFLIIALIIPGGAFGGGDIKMMAPAGFLLGWKYALVATFIGIIITGVYAVVMLAAGKKTRKDHVPFGPGLAFGIYTAFFVGEPILEWYLHIF